MKIIVKEKCKVCGGTGTEPSEKREVRLMKNQRPEKCHHCCGFGEITHPIEIKELTIPITKQLQKLKYPDHILYWEYSIKKSK